MVMETTKLIQSRRTKSVGLLKPSDDSKKVSQPRAAKLKTTVAKVKPLPDFKMPSGQVQKPPRPSHLKKSKSLSNVETSNQCQVDVVKPLRKLRYRKIRKIKRSEDDISLDKLADRLTPYSMLEKRDPNDMSPGLFEGHKLNYQNLPSVSRKPRKNKRESKLTAFESVRLKTLIRCVKEEDCMQIDDKLKDLFHKGILNEDNDTDESDQQNGVSRNFGNLKKALRTYKLRNMANRRLAENAENSHLKKQQKRLQELLEKREDAEDSYNANNKPVKNLKQHPRSNLSQTRQDSVSDIDLDSQRKDSHEMELEQKGEAEKPADKPMAQETTKTKRC